MDAMTHATTTTAPPCILRCDKLKSGRAIRRSARHNWRLDDVPHADPKRAHLNEDWRPVNGPEALLAAVERRLETLTITQPRTESPVLCLEFLITARRQAFKEYGGETVAADYFRDAVAFLERRHGAANVVAVNIQNDEKAPHCVAYVVPIVERPARLVRRNVFARGRDDEGRQRREVREFLAPAEVALSADHYNGTPAKLAALQTAFAEEVAQRHGLARGLEMSAATHTTNRAHHAAIARAMADHIGLTAEELARRGPLWQRERPEEQAARLSELVRAHYAPTVARAATAEHDRRRAREMVATAHRHRARYLAARAELSDLVDGLTSAQRAELARQADDYRATNRRAERQRQREEAARLAAAQREAAERQALEERRQREKEQAKRAAARVRDDALAIRLRDMTPQQFARLEEGWRLHGWRLMRERADLETMFERVAGSGLLEPSGHLSTKGRALVQGEPSHAQRGERQGEPRHDGGDPSKPRPGDPAL